MRFDPVRKTITSGQTETLPIPNPSDFLRISATGGTARIRPVFIEDNRAHNTTDLVNNSIKYDVAGMEGLEVQAVGADVWIQVIPYKDQ